jgi:hypothetical protein
MARTLQYERLSEDETFGEKSRSDNAAQTSRYTWFRKASLVFGIAVTAFACLMAIGTVYSTLIRSTDIARKHCGHSVAEARQQQCRFNMMQGGWVPSECYHEELSEEYLAKGNFQWYSDKYPKEEVSLKSIRLGQHRTVSGEGHLKGKIPPPKKRVRALAY